MTHSPDVNPELTAHANQYPLIHVASVSEALDAITDTWTGIGLFQSADLSAVVAGLGIRGFVAHEQSGSSTVGGSSSGSKGLLHRHGEGEVIVHRTVEGSGTAKLYWPTDEALEGLYEADTQYVTMSDLTEEDLSDKSVEVRMGPDTLIIFPSRTWTEFGTDPQTQRHSVFTHYSQD